MRLCLRTERKNDGISVPDRVALSCIVSVGNGLLLDLITFIFENSDLFVCLLHTHTHTHIEQHIKREHFFSFSEIFIILHRYSGA